MRVPPTSDIQPTQISTTTAHHNGTLDLRNMQCIPSGGDPSPGSPPRSRPLTRPLGRARRGLAGGPLATPGARIGHARQPAPARAPSPRAPTPEASRLGSARPVPRPRATAPPSSASSAAARSGRPPGQSRAGHGDRSAWTPRSVGLSRSWRGISHSKGARCGTAIGKARVLVGSKQFSDFKWSSQRGNHLLSTHERCWWQLVESGSTFLMIRISC